MDTQTGYEQLLYTVWTVNYSNPIPSGYAQNRIWAEGLNEAELALFVHSIFFFWGGGGGGGE